MPGLWLRTHVGMFVKFRQFIRVQSPDLECYEAGYKNLSCVWGWARKQIRREACWVMTIVDPDGWTFLSNSYTNTIPFLVGHFISNKAKISDICIDREGLLED